MNDKSSKFIEKMGRSFDDWNQPRVAGQIVGLLLLTPGEGLTASELAEALSASTGSISTMTGLLVRSGALERIRPPGERKFRFRIIDGFLLRVSQEKFLAAGTMHDLMEEGSNIAPDAATSARFQEMADFYQFFEREVAQLLDKWKQSRQKVQSPTNQEAE